MYNYLRLKLHLNSSKLVLLLNMFLKNIFIKPNLSMNSTLHYSDIKIQKISFLALLSDLE